MKDVRDGLREIVKGGPFNQSAIAKEVGLTPSQFSSILSKNRKMDANEMFAICNAIHIQPGQLIAASADTGQHGAT